MRFQLKTALWSAAVAATTILFCNNESNAFAPVGNRFAFTGSQSQYSGVSEPFLKGKIDLVRVLSSLQTDASSSSTSDDTGDAPPRRPTAPPPRRPGPRNARKDRGRGEGGRGGGGKRRDQSRGPRRPQFSRGGGQGGGGKPQFDIIVLQNPMKVQRAVVERPPPKERPQRERREGGGSPKSARGAAPTGGDRAPFAKPSPDAVGGKTYDYNDYDDDDDDDEAEGSTAKPNKKFSSRGGGGVSAVAPVPGKKQGRAAKVPKKKAEYDDKKRGRPSLRVGTRSTRKMGANRGSLKRKDRSSIKEQKEEAALERRTIQLPEGPMTVGQLSEVLEEKPGIVIKFLMTDMGIMASMTQSLDASTCIAVCEGLGKVVAGAEDFEDDDEEDETALDTGFALDEDDPEDLKPRAPVVTIMGHVDHGKTSLLDAIRNTRVTAGEAGGITQHIGAYQVTHEGSPITFIDTPGHAAFSDMRARGANITDIVILVVAADDGVKQQTADSIVCAKQAGVPIVVAVNKCDLPTADVNKVKSELSGYEILTEDLGGDILSADISAKEGTNLDELLSKIMLQAELQELQANPDRDAQGVIVEARVEKGLGSIATTLIQKGTLRVGDHFVAGEACGKVRALIGDDGKTRYDEAGPSMPISVVGFDEIPSAGDTLVVVENEQIGRELAASRQRIAREKEALSYQSGLMESVAANFAAGGIKEKREMCVVVKADVQGSAEALSRSLSELKLENDEAVVTVKVLVAEAGDVTKTDIAIASVTPDTTVIAFNCAANMAAMDDARVMGVPIGYYSIVYDAIDSVESRMQEVLSPTPEGEYVGSAVVQEVFNIGGTGNIAGSKCQDGVIRKGSNVRVMRGDKILVESSVKTLRNFKAQVDQIDAGDECGIGLADFEDFQPGDVIESYVVQKK